MRARRLLPTLLAAGLVVGSTAVATADEPTSTDASVRLTGELVRTSVERRGDTPRFAVVTGDRFVPVTGAGLADTPAGSTVELDVRAPSAVVAKARPGTDLAAATTAHAVAPGTAPLQVTRVVEAQQASSATYVPATRRITYVEVTPQGYPREAVTPAQATAQVAATDSYWRDQSRGELRIGAPTFAPRYTSAYWCSDDPFDLWNEALLRTGWEWRDNASLVLKLPFDSGPECGYGLGLIGDNPNSAGVLHVADTAAPVLAHELGHNMSLEHANALVCSGRSDSAYDTSADWWTSCDEAEYGDSLDIMGPSSEADLPMLSTPQALRHGLLPPSSEVQVGHGTTRVTLSPLSGGEGTRAAVVTNVNTNARYWVEYRTPTGRDASNPAGQDTGVRVLRTSSWSGSVVLDPTPTGTLDRRVALAPGATLTSYDGRVKFTTESTSSGQAVVRIDNTSRLGSFTLTQAPRITGTKGVGQRLTASTGTWSPTPSRYTYRWKRNGVNIPGATSRTYTPTTADAGRQISVRVEVTRTGYTTRSRTSASVGIPIYATKRPYLHGTATTGHTLTVMVGAWTPKPERYSYQWYRNGVALSGRTAKTYRLTSSDRGKKIHAKVTARRTGYTTGSRTTAMKTIWR